MKIPRRQYNDLYGPTAGDRIRLADTELLIEITRDLTVPGIMFTDESALDTVGPRNGVDACFATRDLETD